jgi:hypothetical protein
MVVHLFMALIVYTSDGDFSFPRFVGLLILSLWSYRSSNTYTTCIKFGQGNCSCASLGLKCHKRCASVIAVLTHLSISENGNKSSLLLSKQKKRKHFTFLWGVIKPIKRLTAPNCDTLQSNGEGVPNCHVCIIPPI